MLSVIHRAIARGETISLSQKQREPIERKTCCAERGLKHEINTGNVNKVLSA